MSAGRIVAVCKSAQHGRRKQPVESAALAAGHGLLGDAHAGSWQRQVSLLEEEQVELMGRNGGIAAEPGAFGENIVTRGVSLGTLQSGSRLRVGPKAVLQLAQSGNGRPSKCATHRGVGDCVMPPEGVFARVWRGGQISVDDPISVVSEGSNARYALLTSSAWEAAVDQQDQSSSVAELLERCVAGQLVTQVVLPEDETAIHSTLRGLCDDEVCDLIIVVGGHSPITSLATAAACAIIDHEIHELAHAMRTIGSANARYAKLATGVYGARGATTIVGLTGSQASVREQLNFVLPALPSAVRAAIGTPQRPAAAAPMLISSPSPALHH